MNSLEPNNPIEVTSAQEGAPAAAEESSFGDVLRQFEAEHQAVEGQDAALEGVVVSISEEAIVVDVGRKMEGILKPDTPGLPAGLAPGQAIMVNISGRTDTPSTGPRRPASSPATSRTRAPSTSSSGMSVAASS